MGILIFKGLTARRFYHSFGFKGLNAICYCVQRKNSAGNEAIIFKLEIENNIFFISYRQKHTFPIAVG
jgi:hypothetical protein